jgi:predicted ATP-dependent serine protease
LTKNLLKSVGEGPKCPAHAATAQELESLRKDFPEVLFAIIMQSTKDGKFKGSNEYAHNSDINIKVEQGKASTIKNRFNELGDFEIFKCR